MIPSRKTTSERMERIANARAFIFPMLKRQETCNLLSRDAESPKGPQVPMLPDRVLTPPQRGAT